MLSFAWRVHKGEMPYRDFIYVRPPVSAFVHSIWFPQLTFLVSGEATVAKLREFVTLRRRFAGTYVTLPASGWNYILNNYKSPVESDWPENTEIGSRESLLEDQIDHRVRYAIVDKTFERSVSDRFGVPLVGYVSGRWNLAYDGISYRVYENARLIDAVSAAFADR